ncbi:MAG: hypothetical protein M0Z75_10445 [Nitrospiraceae bacterium]|nr:hypothetical protein [Nitrospiraceae bacterium]
MKFTGYKQQAFAEHGYQCISSPGECQCENPFCQYNESLRGKLPHPNPLPFLPFYFPVQLSVPSFYIFNGHTHALKDTPGVRHPGNRTEIADAGNFLVREQIRINAANQRPDCEGQQAAVFRQKKTFFFFLSEKYSS